LANAAKALTFAASAAAMLLTNEAKWDYALAKSTFDAYFAALSNFNYFSIATLLAF
jgi:hypothetical protein